MADDTNPEPPAPAEQTTEPTGGPSIEEVLQNARRELATLTELVESAKKAAASTAESQEQTATALADAQTKLTEITAVATQFTAAKAQLAEDQAAVVEAGKVTAATAAETQAKAATALTETQAKLVEITAAAEQEAVAAKTRTTDLQTVIAAKSEHIEGAQVHVDKVRDDLDGKLIEATQKVTETEGLKSRAQSASDATTTLLTEVRTTKGSVETDAAAVAEARKSAEESTALAKGLADKAATVDARIADYEKRIADFGAQCANLLDKSEKILRGSTSVGLSAAWDARRQKFLLPHDRWQKVFVGSLAAIVLLAATGLWHFMFSKEVPTYDELVRLWLARLPIAAALVWLAVHASRESALAKRLEEDYGHKSAMATCFEGFRKEMEDIKDVEPNSPLAQLCANTLNTIATPPGRIYEKHELTVSPVDELKQLVKAATEAAKAAVEAAKPIVEAAAKAGKPLG